MTTEQAERFNAAHLEIIGPDYDMPPQLGKPHGPPGNPEHYMMVKHRGYYYCLYAVVSIKPLSVEVTWIACLETSYQEWDDIGEAGNLYDALDLIIKDSQARPA